jgi:hypothetical protein
MTTPVGKACHGAARHGIPHSLTHEPCHREKFWIFR